jgi:hypothetical protein
MSHFFDPESGQYLLHSFEFNKQNTMFNSMNDDEKENDDPVIIVIDDFKETKNNNFVFISNDDNKCDSVAIVFDDYDTN